MRGRALALLALLVPAAGCASLLAPPAPVEPTAPEREARDASARADRLGGPLCAALTLDVQPQRVAPGEPIAITAALANCGGEEVILDRGLCPDEGAGFRLLLERGGHEYHLHARERAEAAALHDAPCLRAGTSVFSLPPTRSGATLAHIVTFRWNGTFASDPCWPAPSAREAACLHYAPAAPGEHALRARIDASGVTWNASARIVVDGHAESEERACARPTLDASLVLTIENCGTSDLTLDPQLACAGGYPARVEIVHEGRRYDLRPDGAAITTLGCAPAPPARVLFPGRAATARFTWDHTLDGAPAPPGAYEAVARIRATGAGEWEARVALAAP